MLPSNNARVFDSRVGWALTYMVQAALIERPRRAMNQITKQGLDVLREHPDRVDNHVLEAFEEFRDFRARSARVAEHKMQTASTASAQPSPDPTADAHHERSSRRRLKRSIARWLQRYSGEYGGKTPRSWKT